MGCVHISHDWKYPMVLKVLMGIEFLGTVAALTFFGIADPNTYRGQLWQIGSDAGYCSSPDQILYAYANYRPLPVTPLVWSQLATSFNVVVSVFSMFVLLVKLVMFIMHMWYPILSTISNTAIVVLWCVSIYAQAGPDYSDPEHPMPVAWYIAKSCNVAKGTGYFEYCQQAKGAFAVSIIMLIVFLLNLALGIYSLIPTHAQRAERKADLLEEASYQPTKPILSASKTKRKGPWFASATKGNSPISTVTAVVDDDDHHQRWEMADVQTTTDGHYDMKRAQQQQQQQQPLYTPRTLAFHTLDRQLPLRAEQEKLARFY